MKPTRSLPSTQKPAAAPGTPRLTNPKLKVSQGTRIEQCLGKLARHVAPIRLRLGLRSLPANKVQPKYRSFRLA